MRFIYGIIVGVLLTIGTAYVADAMHSAPGPDQKESQRMVNWEVVNTNMRALSTDIQDAWYNLIGKVKEEEKKTGT